MNFIVLIKKILLFFKKPKQNNRGRNRIEESSQRPTIETFPEKIEPNFHPGENVSVNQKPQILLATGIPLLDESIESKLTNVTFTGNGFYREGIISSIEKNQPNVIILSELLEGNITMRELVLQLRTRFPYIRIIYLLKEENRKERSFLYHWMIFDVLSERFLIEELNQAIFHPKTFNDISRDI